MPPDSAAQMIGRYRLVRLIGRGCMGVVYLARDTVADRDVALKVMLPEIVAEANARGRFAREARAAAALQHRNIVTVLDFSEDSDDPYIAMEFLRGTTLDARLTSGKPMSIDTKLDIVIQLCEGLQFAHDQGVVHRDVKPTNIWLLEDGGVKLLDFGIAKLAGSALTQHGDAIGTAAYMAPEQLAGKSVDSRADVFSAGVVLYELLAGRRPFEAETVTGVMMKILHERQPPLRSIAADVSEDVTAAVEMALQKDPSLRYAEAADLGADLRLARHVAGPRTIAAPAPAPPPPAPPPSPPPAAAPPATLLMTPAPVPAPPATLLMTRPAVARPEEAAFDLRIRSKEEANKTKRPAVQRERSRRTAWGVGIAVAVITIAAIGHVAFRGAAAVPFQVDVQSVPAGAAIAINGAPSGKTTPASLTMAEKPERITLTLAGFEPVDAALTASGSGPLNVRYSLQRLLWVRSEPDGARIIFDGQDTGLKTPAELPLPQPAPKMLELQLAGYPPRKEPISQAMLERGELLVTLTAGGAPGASHAATPVHLVGTYAFAVSGCGSESAEAREHTLRVSAPCTLQLRAPRYFLNAQQKIEASGRRVEVSAPELVNAQLRSKHEDCRVLLDGQDVGNPTVYQQVAAGMHTAKLFQCNDQRTYDLRPFLIQSSPLVRLDDYLR